MFVIWPRDSIVWFTPIGEFALETAGKAHLEIYSRAAIAVELTQLFISKILMCVALVFTRV
ncbi:hypothetical protein SAMN04487967_3223 [Natronorubrum sediminis]|uniref:Uncharacterized protein n=1 Tax=Natronorubrum sediminis TaxID=640943 RepID=A0A1H6G5A3_9EURY|nr:hypothetical protein SAMN04487967_3223 [Natronorubrum sediminis]